MEIFNSFTIVILIILQQILNVIAMKSIFFFLIFFPMVIYSQPYLGSSKKPKPTNSIELKSANCSPPNHTTIMETNNVRAMVHTAGNLWQVPNQNFSLYEVPKNSGIMAMFTAALWLGGTDVNGQLKLAALRYRNGQDYWTGPLSQGNAITDFDNCAKYDTHFASTQDMVRDFSAWYEAGLADQQNGTSIQAQNFPNYKVPDMIKNWPAHGDESLGQDYYLAPFFDRNNDGTYSWSDGDYPWYDINKTKECKVDRRVSLFGDENFWWVMNDKGNIHTESGADPIGMEIRAQAFAFATNDEVNNMTFYNYELINRGTQTLYDTYFGFFADGALGDPFDDYVGCDVNRGLGYVYNGDAFDGDNAGFKGYGSTPAAIGVDFFEGPYQDNDGIDNAFGIGPKEALNGIGYGDGIVDNERFGMRRFLYYVNTGGGANPNQTDPISGSDYYNYLRGFWKDGTPFYYGGNGYISDPQANPTVPCDFMFPGDTDPLGWGTAGVPQPEWTEQIAGNEPYDRRFLQSAGPFVLKPGSVNNITVGVVWARASSGDPFASVEVLRRADDKAQALFENCFKVLDGPQAPDLTIQELNNELIFTISNPSNSNNADEDYIEFDPFIVAEDTAADKYYRFQGYLIYQAKDASVSVSDIDNIAKARLVAQCDVKDGVGRIVNFEFDEDLEAAKPVEKVNGENKGIRHSFQIKTDAFAQGQSTLVNFKRYYYFAVSYAHNQYKKFDPDDPTALDGQKKAFIASRKATIGEVKIHEAIPHNPTPESGGTYQNISYGMTPQITRIDGSGNGNRPLDFTASTIQTILSAGKMEEPTYDFGKGPIHVKVVDPLNLVGGYFECVFTNYTNSGTNETVNYYGTDTASWVINRYDKKNGQLLESIASKRTIASQHEQLIPQWGISVEIEQTRYYARKDDTREIIYNLPQIVEYSRYTVPIEATIQFSDSSKRWLSFVRDNDGFTPQNWILSGLYSYEGPDPEIENPLLPPFNNPIYYADEIERFDDNQSYEYLLDGGIAPQTLVNYKVEFSPLAYPIFAGGGMNISSRNQIRLRTSISRSPSVDLVFTNDKTKWTRCAVIELGRDPNLAIGNARAGTLRRSQSVDKEGNPIAGSTGMGWFPGYAIDVENGVRLHMAFGENSFLGTDNGADMIWNPSSRLFDNVGNPVFGGQQPVYVFGYNIDGKGCPAYTENSNWVYDQLALNTGVGFANAYGSLVWIANTLTTEGQQVNATDVKIRVRINKEFTEFTATGRNNGRPMYGWSLDEIATQTASKDALAEALKLINVVPNPYYAYSEYERNKYDTRVKITNLPENCTIKIYNLQGKLMKTFKKSNPTTFQDWTLKNEANIPVASGIYFIHVDVPGVGEVILKSFLGMRLPDVENL
jgi:hypothetical protein